MHMHNSPEIEVSPQPPMGWEEYAEIARTELATLLASGESNEVAYQRLLECHPTLVPAAYGVIDAGHNGMFPDSVISQPPLTGLNQKRPDFIGISWDSGTLYATLIEIESPSKLWATKDGNPRAELTQALQQLRDWKIWFKQDGNPRQFLWEYQVPEELHRDRAFKQIYVLVYGRSADLESSAFQKKRAELQQSDEVLMTWDRLRPNAHYRHLLTSRLTPNGYVALQVPPVVTLGPMFAEYHARLSGKDDAVDASNLIHPERKEFMKQRWKHWDAWSAKRKGGLTIYNSGHQE